MMLWNYDKFNKSQFYSDDGLKICIEKWSIPHTQSSSIILLHWWQTLSMDQHLSYKPDWFRKENMDSYNELTNDNMILHRNLETFSLEVGYFVVNLLQWCRTCWRKSFTSTVLTILLFDQAGWWFIVFNSSVNNIPVTSISWRSFLLVKETRVLEEHNRPGASIEYTSPERDWNSQRYWW